MGRRRTHLKREQPLPPGLYRHGRQYRARRGPSESWTYFGPDYVAAMASFAAWRRDGPTVDTIAWLLDLFAGTICAGYVKAGRISSRTARDYGRDKEPLKDGLGHIPIKALTGRHVAEYRDARAQDTSHVRQEIACLSAAMSYAVEAGRVTLNPCRGIRKPRRVRRERLIADDEYLKVYAVAGVAVRTAMILAIRTLALPADLLAMGPRNVIRLTDGKRALRFARGKTGRLVEIELVGELAALVDQHLAADVVYPTFVHRRDGKRFTVDGIGAMFRRYCSAEKANVEDFGLRDLRAKGATDMVRRQVDIRQVQHLLGHASVRTTEIYIKGLLPTTVRPNETPIIASVK